VPLANLVTLREVAGPDQLSRFDRMRAITVEAGLAEGVSLGQAVSALEERVRAELPSSARITWDGEARDFQRTGSSLFLTFGLALVIVFLVLAAQFESFVHPMIILVTVPLALIGAILGILIVEFANQLRDRGQSIGDAVVEASTTRLRPIIMTSASTMFGALPLLLATGAGAESRQPIGIVIVFGVAVSAVLTLFAVPALYAVLARFTRSPHYVASMIARLRKDEPARAGAFPEP
jgi:multidrug efflux pump